MQRVTRDVTANRDGLAALDAKIALIRKHFPPKVANLYAIPRHGSDGVLEWWSVLTGQPVRYHELNEEQQHQLLEKYQQRQDAVGYLADALHSRGQEAAADSLRTLIGAADLNNLYSINGEPLVVRWGTENVLAIPSPVLPRQTPNPSPPAPIRISPTRWRLWPWLLLLLLLGLLSMLWFWRSNIFDLLRPAQGIENYACRQNADGLPPEFVVVLDTSGSMGINANTSREDEHWFFFELEEWQRSLPIIMSPADQERLQRLKSSPSRLDIAKESFATMIGGLHPDIDMRLITFAGCMQQVDHGLFSAAQRPALIAGINRLKAGDGTPLAASLEKAASLVDGRERDAVVVMFIDGEDGCEQNACAVSQQIAKRQPRLQVNVVNLSDSEAPNCIAKNTGGQVYSTRDALEVSAMLQEASQAVSRNARCE